MEIKLGQTVKDLTTNLVGTAVNKIAYMNGNTQFCLQPKGDGNTVPDAYSVDYHLLEVVDEGISARAIKSVEDKNIPLGSTVKCLVTGITGITTMKTFYLNGCISYLVEQKESLMNKPKTDWVDQAKLVIVDKGITDVYKEPKPNSDGVKTGGAPVRNMFKRG